MRLLFIILLIYAGTAWSQPYKASSSKKTSNKEIVPDFKNNAEQEEYYVKKMFKEEYKKQTFNKFVGSKKVVNDHTFQFDNLTINIFYTSADLKTIIAEGFLYPKLLGEEDSLKITDFQELKYVNDKPQYRRFSFWLFRKLLANPQVYYIELTNDKATPGTELREFIKGAQLTYFNPGNIII
jgi:hypothetical protein